MPRASATMSAWPVATIFLLVIGGNDVYLIYLADDGVVEWRREIGGQSDDRGMMTVPGTNGGFMTRLAFLEAVELTAHPADVSKAARSSVIHVIRLAEPSACVISTYIR